MDDTELRLITWRGGPTQSERLAASVLRLAGFEAIDPQAPLGGGDGGKDILCAKGGLTWVGAVHFPSTPCSYTKSKSKFSSDLQKAPREHRGFAFITNQHLTIKQRQSLQKIGKDSGRSVEIFHLERVSTLLDSPSGYGVRLQFLSIPMTIEEQLAWFADSGGRVEQALELNTRELRGLKSMVQQVLADSTEIMRTVASFENLQPPTPDLLSTSNFVKSDKLATISENLSPEDILLFHRLTAFDLPSNQVGALREVDVYLGTRGNPELTAKLPNPTDPSQIPRLLDELCRNWREDYRNISRGTVAEKLSAVAKFHAILLKIHPFLDGNGRTARAILMQQCLDLFGRANMSLLNRGQEYYSALRAADTGDTAPLIALFSPIIDG